MGRAASVATWPLELLFRAGSAVRRTAYDRGWARVHRVPVPAVSVGNLVVGGTGKTPVAGWLVRRLAESGLRPALVARGYGEDELALHRRWNPDVPVHAHPDRVRAALEAARTGADVLVLDDGFQHRRLGRDLDLVLVAAEHPLPGPLLPRGPYREPPAALARADAVLVTHRTADAARVHAVREHLTARFPSLTLGTVSLVAGGWTDLAGAPATAPDGPVLAVTSVAGPEGVATVVARTTGGGTELLAFPDHHDFGEADVARIRDRAEGRTVVTTEKDAVKLARWAGDLPPVRVLALGVEPDPGTRARVEAWIGTLGRRPT